MRWIQRQEPAASEHRRKIRARKKDVLGGGNLEDSIIRRTEYKTCARQGICGTGARTPRMLPGYQHVVVKSKPAFRENGPACHASCTNADCVRPGELPWKRKSCGMSRSKMRTPPMRYVAM